MLIKLFKREIALFICLALVMSLIPAVTMPAKAADTAPIVNAPAVITCNDTPSDDSFIWTYGALSATDSDGTVVSYGISGGAIGGSTIIDTVPYDVSKAGTYGTLYLNSATGEYLFMPNNIAINALSSTQSETYTVTATDNEGITGAATLTVIINGVNDTPTITAPTSINVIVWTANVLTGISFADVDAGSDNVTVTLSVPLGSLAATSGAVTVGGTASALTLTGTIADINAFIAGGGVTLTGLIDSVTLTVMINDNGSSGTGGAKSASKDIPLNIAPRILSVTSSTANGSYKAGAEISIQVRFSAPVTVTGTPQLVLETGVTDRPVNYVSGTGTDTLTFSYTVQAGDNNYDLDYVNTNALTLNGGTITRDGVNAILTLPPPGAADSLGGNKAIIIDTTAPNEPFVSITSADDSGISSSDGITNVTALRIEISGEIGASVELDFGDGSPFATGTMVGGSFTSPIHTYTAGSKYTVSAVLTDSAGNKSAAGTKVIVIDTIAPSITTPAEQTIITTAATNGATVCALTATDATTISDFTDSLIWSITDGAEADKFSIAGSNLKINNAGGLGAGSYTLQVTAKDTAGNTDTQTLTITVVDVPTVDAVTHSYNDTAANDTFAYSSGNISATANTGSIVGYGIDGGAIAPAGSEFTYESVSYNISKAGTYGTLYVNSDNGMYVYIPASDALLNAQTVTVTDIFTITATDSAATGGNSLTISINGVNDAPVISTADTVSVVEGSLAAFTASGTDPEGSAITWSITGGADAAKFSINAATGAVTFVTAPSFGTPTDDDADNSYVLQITASDGLLTASKTVTVMVIQPPAYDDTPSVPTPPNSAVVEVNGEKHDAGQASTQTTDGTTTTTITVDDTKLSSILEIKGDNATVTLPASGTPDVVVGVLTGQTVKNMEQKEAVLEIKTETVTYTLPASQINIDDISSQFGSQVELKDIKVSVKIAEPPADTVKVIEDTASKGNYQLVVKPVEFEVTCTSGDTTVEVSRFNAYVERTIAIPDGVDPSTITTGIVLNADGTFTHVPTQIVMINGKYYAKINSLTNSTYSVISNTVTFTDVEGHWAKDAVNDMGSRIVVTGVGNGIYEPDRSITRAEFAAIIVRALGLKKGTTESAFSDVTLTDWYNGYVDTAAAYGLITGYDSKTFAPNDSITREQAMTILARAMKLTGLNVTLTDNEVAEMLANYSDASRISDYAKAGAAACIKAGVVTGTTASTLSPKDSVTRAEVAVMVQRLLIKSGLI